MKLEHVLFVFLLISLTACTANPTAAPGPPMEAPPRTSPAAEHKPAGGNASTDARPAATKPRFLLILFDSSQSYALYEEAVRKAIAIVNALGPGDRLVIARMGEKFQPETKIKLQATMPDIPAELLAPTTRLAQWRQNQARVNAIWRQIETLRLEIAAYLANHLRGKNTAAVTDLWGALDYCARRLSGESAFEKHLIIFSDLEHDFEKQRASHPPVQRMEFGGVHACLLYVPWTNNFAGLQRDWGAWFKGAGVADFLILDSSQSDQLVVITPSPKPELRSPFAQS